MMGKGKKVRLSHVSSIVVRLVVSVRLVSGVFLCNKSIPSIRLSSKTKVKARKKLIDSVNDCVYGSFYMLSNTGKRKYPRVGYVFYGHILLHKRHFISMTKA